MKQTNKAKKVNKKQEQPKSVVRYVWVRMKEEGVEKLADKKRIFKEVLSESTIRPWTANYMINKVNKMRTHQEFDSYLVNSKNYFEKQVAPTI